MLIKTLEKKIKEKLISLLTLIKQLKRIAVLHEISDKFKIANFGTKYILINNFKMF